MSFNHLFLADLLISPNPGDDLFVTNNFGDTIILRG